MWGNMDGNIIRKDTDDLRACKIVYGMVWVVYVVNLQFSAAPPHNPRSSLACFRIAPAYFRISPAFSVEDRTRAFVRGRARNRHVRASGIDEIVRKAVPVKGGQEISVSGHALFVASPF